MSLYFPDTSQINPETGNIWADGDTYQSTNGVTYKWDATHGGWVALSQDIDAYTKVESDDRYVQVDGDIVKGPLILQDEFGSVLYPTADDGAVPKGYVDDEIINYNINTVQPIKDDLDDLTLEVDKKVSKATDTMTGPLHLQNIDGSPQNILVDDQATTKAYVDKSIQDNVANPLTYHGKIDATQTGPTSLPVESGDFYIHDTSGNYSPGEIDILWGFPPGTEIEDLDRLLYDGNAWAIIHTAGDYVSKVGGDNMEGPLEVDAVSNQTAFVVKGHAGNDLFGVRHDDTVVDNNGPYALNEDGSPYTAVQDSQLVTKGFADDTYIPEDDADLKYVKKEGSDEMEGPLEITGGRDPDANGIVSTLKALNIDSGQSSDLQLKYGGAAKVWVGGSQITIQEKVKFNQNGLGILSNTNNEVFRINSSGAFYLGNYTAEDHIVTKKDAEALVFDDITDDTTNKYLKRSGDNMTGDLRIDQARIVFDNPNDGQQIIRVNRNAGETVDLAYLAHPAGSTVVGNYDITMTGNTNYNVLRLRGGSGGDTTMFAMRANGGTDWYTNFSMNGRRITDLGDPTNDDDAVSYGYVRDAIQEKYDELISSVDQGKYYHTTSPNPVGGRFYSSGNAGYTGVCADIIHFEFADTDLESFNPDFGSLSVGDTLKVLSGTTIRSFRVKTVPYKVSSVYIVDVDSGKGEDISSTGTYYLNFVKLGGTVNLTDYLKIDASNGPITGNLAIDVSGKGAGNEAQLTIKGNRTGSTNAAATLIFDNESQASATPGYLMYRSSNNSADGEWFKFNKDVDFTGKGLHSVGYLSPSNEANKKIVLRNPVNNGADAAVEIQRQGDSRQSFAIKGKNEDGDLVNILSTYSNVGGPDAVNYVGKMDSAANLATVGFVTETLDALGGGISSDFVDYGNRYYRRSGDSNATGGFKNLVAGGAQRLDSFTQVQIHIRSYSDHANYPNLYGADVNSLMKLKFSSSEAIYRVTSVTESGSYYDYDLELVSSKGTNSIGLGNTLTIEVLFPVVRTNDDVHWSGRHRHAQVIETDDSYTQELYSELEANNLDLFEIPTVGFVLAAEYKKSISFGTFTMAVNNNVPTAGQINMNGLDAGIAGDVHIHKTDNQGNTFPFERFYDVGDYIAFSKTVSNEEENWVARINTIIDNGDWLKIIVDSHTAKRTAQFSSGAGVSVAKSGKLDQGQVEYLVHEHATIPGYRPFYLYTTQYSPSATVTRFYYWNGSTNNPSDVRFSRTCANYNLLEAGSGLTINETGFVYIATPANTATNSKGNLVPDPANNDFKVRQILKYNTLTYDTSARAFRCSGCTQSYRDSSWTPSTGNLIYVKCTPLY